ncbi:MAG: hypothetical protein L0H10_06335 [Comamonas sp.]|uniref:hypothetical protein n=1 Tax=Comamonas testosteroni TaxID=285 RepID=UPI0006B91036|nr:MULTISPECIES: hypothetical protein [Comamonas]MDN5503424.1 hypothetical protein [Comamonas sp.]
MILRELLKKQGLDSFTVEDFKFVTSKIAEDPDRLILVGGQAIAVWGIIFDVPSPLGAHQTLTEDADWLGGKLDAKWLSSRLGAPSDVELHLAGDFDATPSAAIVYLLRDGKRVLLMDFLRAIAGLAVEDIVKFAVSVELEGGRLQVMHPLLCLESRFANLELIASKRLGNGPLQAQWMIAIANKFLLTLLQSAEDPAQVAKAIRQIAELAEYKAGRYCFMNFQLDALDAIPAEAIAYAGKGFAEQEWPRIVRRITAKRQSWLDFRQRQLQAAQAAR